MNPIEQNANYILKIIMEKEMYTIGGGSLKKETGLSPQDINDAVEFLEEINAIKVLNAVGTSPYNFWNITINSKGKRIYYDNNPTE